MTRKKKKGISRPRVPKKDWKHDIKVSQDYICPVCNKQGTDYTMDIHHTCPVSRGGKNTKENCVAWHKSPCHRNYHKEHGVKKSDRQGNPIE